MGTVSVTYRDHNKSIHEWLSRGKKMVLGTLTLATYAGGGLTCSITGFTTIESVFIQNTGGRTFDYTHSTSILRAAGGYNLSTSTYTFECASDTELACFTAPLFIAIGVE